MSGIRGVTGLQTAMATILTSSADVMRKTRVADISGGQTDTYARFATYPCKYEQAKFIPREREQRGVLIESDAYWIFVFPHDADVRPTDRLVTGGMTFEVSGGGTPSLGLYNQITCLRIV